MSKIVYLNEKIIIIEKPSGVSSQPDNTSGEDALTDTAKSLRSGGEKSNLYPIHRLDKVVGGLLVFARDSSTAAALSSLVSDGEFNKEYLAVVEGIPEDGSMIDYLSRNSTLGKAIVSKAGSVGAKYAELDCKTVETVKDERGVKTLVKISLKTGRFHQIRAQLSSRDHPLIGDKKYGSRDHRAKTPALFAYRLAFELGGESINQDALPDISVYPWNLFKKESYLEV